MWTAVVGWEGLYEVCRDGVVRNARTKRVLRPMRTGSKRPGAQRSKVRLSTSPRTDLDVARAVLWAFVGPPGVGQVAMHADDNSANNHVDNLRWGSLQENARDMAHKGRGGAQSLSAPMVSEIRRRRIGGERGASLAREFGVSQQRVCDIYKGRTTL